MRRILAFLVIALQGWCQAQDISRKRYDLSLEGARANLLAYSPQEAQEEFGTDNVFEQGIDLALIDDRSDDYCLVAFRGSTSVSDYLRQNLNILPRQVCSKLNDTKCCSMNRGIVNAYSTTEEWIEERIDLCLENNKKIVFTGHSQGGAIASVAAMRYNEFMADFITFGQPPAFRTPCPHIDESRVLRWINTVTEAEAIPDMPFLQYDPVPFLAAGFGDLFGIQLGAAVVFPAEVGSVAHLVFYNQSSDVPWPQPEQLDRVFAEDEDAMFAHFIVSYWARFQDVTDSILLEDVGPFTKGFLAQSRCTFDSECIGYCNQTTWKCVGNLPPVAVCTNVRLPNDCQVLDETAIGEIAGKSYDPEGSDLDIQVNPQGPFHELGDHSVTVTVSDGEASSVCEATITIVDTTTRRRRRKLKTGMNKNNDESHHECR